MGTDHRAGTGWAVTDVPKPVPVGDTGSQPHGGKLQEIARSYGITEMLLSSPLLSLRSSPFLSSPPLWHVGTITVLLLQDLLWAQPLRASTPGLQPAPCGLHRAAQLRRDVLQPLVTATSPCSLPMAMLWGQQGSARCSQPLGPAP